ncbi:MAG: fused MFS/spermidine synthase [Bryobacteraceae bacterium]
MSGTKEVRGALVLTGASAVIAQIVLMRELIVVFRGNELSLGLMLATWLLWTAAGSSILGRAAGRAHNPRRMTAALFVLVAAVLPATIYAVRASRQFVATAPGEALGPGAVLAVCFVTLSAFCALAGCLFAAASRLYGAEAGAAAGESTGTVYLLEAAGSAAGGLLASVVLLRHAGAFEIAFLVASCNLIAAAALVLRRPSERLAAAVAVLAGFALSGSAVARLERASLERLWHGFRLVVSENSVYGNLAVIAGEASGTIYESGVPVATVPDPPAAEEAVHYALLQHPAPRSLLLIGGGVNGSLAQALQHRTLERVDYVELDPALIGVAQKYFTAAWGAAASDPRVHIHNLDGRLYLKTTGRDFDVIIVNLPEPRTAQLNRFYTLEFFREADRRLTSNGVLAFQLRASEDYISPELGALLASIRKTLGAVFPEVGLMPGESVHFFAAKQAGVLAGPGLLLDRLRERQLRTLYVREYFIPYRMTPERVRDLDEQSRPTVATPLNRDFAPIAYYFATTLWAAEFNHAWRRVFDSIARVPFSQVSAWLAVALAGIVIALRRSGARACALFSAGATGFAMMGLEILLLLGFQAVYGYVYHQLALLTAMFMAGMALGAWRGLRGSGALGALAGIQVAAAVAPFLACAFLDSLAGVRAPALLTAASQLLFPALAVACGAIGGWQFAVASRVYFGATQAEACATLGALYAIDLAGACLGALALSTCVIPVFGFLNTAAVIAMVSLAPALAALICARADSLASR